jgi:asparagine synthase (glutamine-hydrolysing)
MADMVLDQGGVETSRLDTVSYYNNSEPNWNERPYFLKVEEKRRKSGCHIDVSSLQSSPELGKNCFSATPGSKSTLPDSTRQLAEYTFQNGHVVILSGTGGDEVLGGIPSPIPELADLLTRLQLRRCAAQLSAWALAKRRPLIHLITDLILEFLPVWLVGMKSYQLRPDWLEEALVKRQSSAVGGYETRLRIHGPLPSFQENLRSLEGLRRQLGCTAALATPRLETRYPYLDRDLLEFLYAIPREQLLRPWQRRSLMRRALKDIVPAEVLNRRKAGAALTPLNELAEISHSLQETDCELLCARMGIINQRKLQDSFEQLRRGQNTNIVGFARTVSLEYWLRDLLDSTVVQFSAPQPSRNSKAFVSAVCSSRPGLCRPISRRARKFS